MNAWLKFKKSLSVIKPSKRESIIAKNAFYCGYLYVLEELHREMIPLPSKMQGLGHSLGRQIDNLFAELEKGKTSAK